jgi:hypothetical protein
MALLFRDHRHDTRREAVGVRHVGRDETDAGRLEAKQEVRIPFRRMEQVRPAKRAQSTMRMIAPSTTRPTVPGFFSASAELCQTTMPVSVAP